VVNPDGPGQWVRDARTVECRRERRKSMYIGIGTVVLIVIIVLVVLMLRR
jgi:Tfp pilus assembly protein PilN